MKLPFLVAESVLAAGILEAPGGPLYGLDFKRYCELSGPEKGEQRQALLKSARPATPGDMIEFRWQGCYVKQGRVHEVRETTVDFFVKETRKYFDIPFWSLLVMPQKRTSRGWALLSVLPEDFLRLVKPATTLDDLVPGAEFTFNYEDAAMEPQTRLVRVNWATADYVHFRTRMRTEGPWSRKIEETSVEHFLRGINQTPGWDGVGASWRDHFPLCGVRTGIKTPQP